MISLGGMDREVHDKIKATKSWMREQRIPKPQQEEAIDYFRHMYRAKCTYDEGDILSAMPPAMHLSFCKQLYSKAVKTVPMFR